MRTTHVRGSKVTGKVVHGKKKVFKFEFPSTSRTKRVTKTRHAHCSGVTAADGQTTETGDGDWCTGPPYRVTCWLDVDGEITHVRFGAPRHSRLEENNLCAPNRFGSETDSERSSVEWGKNGVQTRFWSDQYRASEFVTGSGWYTQRWRLPRGPRALLVAGAVYILYLTVIRYWR